MTVNTWTKKDIFALCVCSLIGITLAVLPHFAVFLHTGTFEYLADGDDVVYLAIAKVPYYGEWALRDPFTRPSDAIPTLYSWLQFVPIAKLASWLGIPLIFMPLLWRILGGIFLGTALYVLFRLLFENCKNSTFWAFIATTICLSDGGMIIGRSFLDNFFNLKAIIFDGSLPSAIGNAVLPQYRVVTPLLNLPFVLILSALLLPAVRRTWQTAVLGGILLGCCIHLYFFYWTATIMALVMYGLVYLFWGWKGFISKESSLQELRFVGLILVGGLIIGLPQIASNSAIFSSPEFKPILERMSRGARLYINDPFRFTYVVNFWTWMQLSIGAIAILYFRYFNLGILWLMTFSGYGLLNSAIVTGLEFENFHWNYISKPFGEILLLGSLILIFQDKKVFSQGMKFLVLVILITGIFARNYEAVYAKEPMKYTKILKEIEPLRPALSEIDQNSILAGSFEANVASLFTQGGQLFQFNQTSHSSAIPDHEVLERHALNAWLLGYSMDKYKDTDFNMNFTGGKAYLKPPKWQPERIKANMVEIFNSLLSGEREKELLEKYAPNYLLLDFTQKPTRGGEWQAVTSNSPNWTLWKRK